MIPFIQFLKEQSTELLTRLVEHIELTVLSLLLATIIGITLSIVGHKKTTFKSILLLLANAVQTIPSLALLGFLIPMLGIGFWPSILALFLYGLLPIIRNTLTGLENIPPHLDESARGMGLTPLQRLRLIEIPLTLPYIFAGIRTAAVINIGVATLAALIGAGGLGTLIFRGIALNNNQLLLAGALPASLLALLTDGLLGWVQKRLGDRKKTHTYAKALIAMIFLSILSYFLFNSFGTAPPKHLAGLNPEFIEREDGLKGLQDRYGFEIPFKEMEINLMYKSLKEKEVDLIAGFSTDGRITLYGLKVLEDDRNYFPPYYAAPIIRSSLIRDYPDLKKVINQLGNRLNESDMINLNALADVDHKLPKVVAEYWYKQQNFPSSTGLKLPEQLIIGSKGFTENFILSEILALHLSKAGIETEVISGFGGTKLLIDGMLSGQIDLYPEYTGTGLTVVLQPQKDTLDKLITDPDLVYRYVQQGFKSRYDLEWLAPFGFNNTTALMIRKSDNSSGDIEKISDLKNWFSTP